MSWMDCDIRVGSMLDGKYNIYGNVDIYNSVGKLVERLIKEDIPLYEA